MRELDERIRQKSQMREFEDRVRGESGMRESEEKVGVECRRRVGGVSWRRKLDERFGRVS